MILLNAVVEIGILPHSDGLLFAPQTDLGVDQRNRMTGSPRDSLGCRRSRSARVGHVLVRPAQKARGHREIAALAEPELDRLILASELMGRVTAKASSSSKLPELMDLFLLHPLVTAPLEAKLLKATAKAVDLMLAQFGGALPHELTGRALYRASGIV